MSPSVQAGPILKPVCLALTIPLKYEPEEQKVKNRVVVLDPSVFNHPIRRDILHLCVVHYRDSLRQGTASTKTRGEVRGSGRKLIRQKGTGLARVGDGQSPIRVGGGVAFGPKPRDFSTKLPRKVIQMGMRVALSVKVKEEHLGVMTHFDWPNGKTKYLAAKIDDLGLRKTLFVTGGEPSVGLERAIRSIKDVKLIDVTSLNVYEILKWQRVVMDLKAVEFIEWMFRKDFPRARVPFTV